MSDKPLSHEASRLLETLAAPEVTIPQIEGGFSDFSEQAKVDLVEHLARTFSPAPNGQLIGRLAFIQTPANRDAMRATYLANLRSPDPEARAASLRGLEQLKHPAIADLAVVSLRDQTDIVLTAACQILLPLARKDARLADLLRDCYRAHESNSSLHMSMNLLKAKIIKRAAP